MYYIEHINVWVIIMIDGVTRHCFTMIIQIGLILRELCMALDKDVIKFDIRRRDTSGFVLWKPK